MFNLWFCVQIVVNLSQIAPNFFSFATLPKKCEIPQIYKNKKESK